MEETMKNVYDSSLIDKYTAKIVENVDEIVDFDSYGMSFQRNLRLLRKSFGLKATDLADFCKTTRQTILNIENGSSTLKKPMFVSLLHLMGQNKAKWLSNPLAFDVWEYYIYEKPIPTHKKRLFCLTLESYIENFYRCGRSDDCLGIKFSWAVMKDILVKNDQT